MFIMTEVGEVAFEDLKRAFTTTLLLKYYDPTLPIKVEIDASGRAIGAIIS